MRGEAWLVLVLLLLWLFVDCSSIFAPQINHILCAYEFAPHLFSTLQLLGLTT